MIFFSLEKNEIFRIFDTLARFWYFVFEAESDFYKTRNTIFCDFFVYDAESGPVHFFCRAPNPMWVVKPN